MAKKKAGRKKMKVSDLKATRGGSVKGGAALKYKYALKIK